MIGKPYIKVKYSFSFEMKKLSIVLLLQLACGHCLSNMTYKRMSLPKGTWPNWIYVEIGVTDSRIVCASHCMIESFTCDAFIYDATTQFCRLADFDTLSSKNLTVDVDGHAYVSLGKRVFENIFYLF